MMGTDLKSVASLHRKSVALCPACPICHLSSPTILSRALHLQLQHGAESPTMQPQSDATRQLDKTTKQLESSLQSFPAHDGKERPPDRAKAEEILTKLYVSRRGCASCTPFPYVHT